MELAIRLERHFEPEPTSGCWLWFGCSNPRGYGKVGSGDGRTLLAHRASWMVHRGEIPDGLCVLHKCDTPSCINPEHLFLGTYRDNAIDREAKGRGGQYRGEDHGRAKITESDVIEILRLCSHGCRNKDIAKKFSVSTSLVSAIKSRRIWRHLAV